tara:strand:+ start:10540 stop:13275 length:2736 start_codon:yes stop_codon:yes gene_type:complete
MASSLHYVTPLQLSDTFNEWFLRSNDLIDVVNKINVYNVNTGWGLAKYRNIDGTTLIRLNIGQQENEYDASGGVSGDWKYGLRFIDDGGTTGASHPDVSDSRKILTLDFENLPGPSGGVSGAYVLGADTFAYADSSSGTGSIRRVTAQNILPYGISGDHRFYGNIYFDGTNTTINSSELWIDDKTITLATSNTGDSTGGYLNDALLHGAGIVIKGASGDKELTYEYTETSGSTFHAFKTNIDFEFGNDSKILSEDSTLKFRCMRDEDFDLILTTLTAETKEWKIRRTKSGDTQGKLVFFYEDTDTGITAEAITLSKLGTVRIHELDGDRLSGVTHDSTFKYLPAPYSVPTTGMSADSYLNYKWTNRKTVTQVAHGFTHGDLLRYFPGGSTYEWAYNATPESSEVICIVEDASPGSSADQFVAVFSGLVDLSLWTPKNAGASGWSGSAGTTMETGSVYFLDAVGNSGGWTASAPNIDGVVRKPVLLSVGEQEGLFVNYIGNIIATGTTSDATTSTVLSSNDTGYLVDPSFIPNQEFKNKIINGDFSFWQRAEDRRLGMRTATAWNGTTGARFATGSSWLYTADMWMIDTRPHGTTLEVQKIDHLLTSDIPNTSPYGTEPRGSYLRALNGNDHTFPGSTGYLVHRIENVSTLAPTTGEDYATLSYWIRGSIGGSGATAFNESMAVSLWQVFDGNSGGALGISASGGATSCVGIDVGSGATYEFGHSVTIPATWTKKSHTFRLNSTTAVTGGSPVGTAIDSSYNWLQLQFEMPTRWGMTGGFDLARVQLEGGSGATDWDARPIQIEENLVNRYYQRQPIYIEGYVASGGTLGIGGKFDTIPYPYYGHASDADLSGKCSFAHNIGNTGCAAGATTDVRVASVSKGFNVSRLSTNGQAGAVHINGVYHFDFGITDV